MELGQEGKGRCGWQSRGAGPLFGRMAPAEDLGLQRVSLSPRGPDKVCPACCGGVGVGQGVGEEGAGKEPLTGHSKHWGPFHLLNKDRIRVLSAASFVKFDRLITLGGVCVSNAKTIMKMGTELPGPLL